MNFSLICLSLIVFRRIPGAATGSSPQAAPVSNFSVYKAARAKRRSALNRAPAGELPEGLLQWQEKSDLPSSRFTPARAFLFHTTSTRGRADTRFDKQTTSLLINVKEAKHRFCDLSIARFRREIFRLGYVSDLPRFAFETPWLPLVGALYDDVHCALSQAGALGGRGATGSAELDPR
jgi:hypothetical protein